MEPFPDDGKDVCRLCLYDDEEYLIPSGDVIENTVSLELLQRFTTVQLLPQECLSYALCIDCGDRLNSAVAFLNACEQNDATFRKLFKLHVQRGTKKHAVKEEDQWEEFFANNEQELEHQIQTDEFGETEVNLLHDDDGECSTDESTLKIEILDKKKEKGTEDVAVGNETIDQHQQYFNEHDYVAGPSIETECETESSQIEWDTFSPKRRRLDEQHGHDTERVECMICNVKFANAACYQSHYRECHPHGRRKNKSKGLRGKQLCGICGLMVANLDSHLLTHSGAKPFACPHCPVQVRNKANLARHIKALHLKKPAKTCEMCGKQFIHANVHKTHMFTFHGIGKMYECEICSKKLATKQILRRHIAVVHQKERRFPCKMCGKAFKVPTHRRMHEQMVHTTEKPFACSFCSKRFKTAVSHRNHEQVHEGVRFYCTMCGDVFRYKGLLQGHIRRIHGKVD